MKQCATCLDYQHIQPQEKTIPYKLQRSPWETLGADIFSINNETLLCIVDYHNKFPVVKTADRLSPYDLIRATRVMFAEFGQKIVSDAGMNFMLDHFKKFCRQLNIDWTIISSYHHQSNGQVKVCIKFVKCTIKCFDNHNDIYLVLL